MGYGREGKMGNGVRGMETDLITVSLSLTILRFCGFRFERNVCVRIGRGSE
jgi:hypothetical protein